MKTCARCKQQKPSDAFGRNLYAKDKLRPYCRECSNVVSREQRERMKRKAGVAQGYERDVPEPPPLGVGEPSVVMPGALATPAPPSVIPPLPLLPRHTVVAIGDIHFPWHNGPALSRVVEIIREIRPDFVVQMGDLYDLFSFSKFARSLNVMTPSDEVETGRAYAEFFWKQVKAASPASQCYQLWGNHDSRASKRTLERLPEAEGFVARGMRDLMTFEGVSTVDYMADELTLDGVYYTHGFLSQLGDHVRKLARSCVTAHLHVGGVVTTCYEDKITFELGCGWLGNRRAPVFSYHALKRAHGTTQGVGVIDPYGPRFIPF